MKNVTKENFKEEVLDSDVKVLVDFWAPWCGPCRAIAPMLEELAEFAGEKAKVVKLNVDDSNELAFTYNVSSIPTLIVFDKGKVESVTVGMRPLEELKKLLAL